MVKFKFQTKVYGSSSSGVTKTIQIDETIEIEKLKEESPRDWFEKMVGIARQELKKDMEEFFGIDFDTHQTSLDDHESEEDAD